MGGAECEDGQPCTYPDPYYFDLAAPIMLLFPDNLLYSGTFGWLLAYAIAFSICVFVPLLPISLIYYVASRLCGIRLNAKALSTRLWRVTIAFALLLALNQLGVWVEQQQWTHRRLEAPLVVEASRVPAATHS
jgi:hypothetical protein